MIRYFMNNVRQHVDQILSGRGWTREDLSKGTGLSLRTLSDLIDYETHAHRRIRKVELFLGEAVWTSPERFEELNRCSALIGADVVLTGFHDLRRRAIAMKVPSARSITSKEEIISALLLHEKRRAEYEANPDPLRADVFGREDA